MKEGLIQLFAVIGVTATIMGCIYGVGKFAEFLSEICTRVGLLEKRHQAITRTSSSHKG